MHEMWQTAVLTALVPMPSTSPFLLAMLVVLAYLTLRPCGYCMAIMLVVFLSTSPSSPFISALTTPIEVPQPPQNSTLLSSHLPGRLLLFPNGGRIFDPALVGYREMQRVWLDPPASTSSAITAPEDTPDAPHVDTESSAKDADVAAYEQQMAEYQQQMAAYEKEVRRRSWLPRRLKLPEKPRNPRADASAAKPEDKTDGLGWWPGKWRVGMSSFNFAPNAIKQAQQASKPAPEVKIVVPSRPATPPIRDLPPNYYSFRIAGVGLVIDLGWRRTDAGLGWELEEQKHAADVRRWRRAERDARRAEREGAVSVQEKPEEKNRQWYRSPFTGSW